MQSIKLGVISDVQYCDCENGSNYERTIDRFYRNSINHLDNAIEYFLANNCRKVLQLGDLIDGKCSRFQQTESAMDLMKERFETDEFETFHVVGNHELYNLSREKLCASFIGSSLRKYKKTDQDLNYYRVDLSADICLIILDCYEISILNKRDLIDNHPDYLQALEILRTNNGNESWNEPNGTENSKFVAFNGGIGERQLAWLEKELKKSTLNNQIVILVGHIPIICSSSNQKFLLWNNSDVLDIIDQYSCVKAYICGHFHIGGVLKSNRFIHITMPGVVESFKEQCAYGILEITKESLHLSALPGYWNEILYNFA